MQLRRADKLKLAAMAAAGTACAASECMRVCQRTSRSHHPTQLSVKRLTGRRLRFRHLRPALRDAARRVRVGWLPHAPPRSAGRAAALVGAASRWSTPSSRWRSSRRRTRTAWTERPPAFEYLALAGVPFDGEAEMDFGGTVLAFEQAFNPGSASTTTTSASSRWRSARPTTRRAVRRLAGRLGKFHRKWRLASVEAVLEQEVSKKYEERREARGQGHRQLKARQDEFEAALVAARAQGRLAAEPDVGGGARGEGEDGQLVRAARGRRRARGAVPLLDLDMWSNTDSVGGLDDALEQVRRVWVPLCAPRRCSTRARRAAAKGLLLYGPPGCGKSLLAARLAAGLRGGRRRWSRRYGQVRRRLGQQLRNLFVTIPPVPARPGDAEDTMIVAEANELHVIVRRRRRRPAGPRTHTHHTTALSRARPAATCMRSSTSLTRSRGSGAAAAARGRRGNAARDSVVNAAGAHGRRRRPAGADLVIALTNRRELVDNAILQPGASRSTSASASPTRRGARRSSRSTPTRCASRPPGLSGSGGSAGSGGDGGSASSSASTTRRTTRGSRSPPRPTPAGRGARGDRARGGGARARPLGHDERPQGYRVTDDDFDYAVEDLRIVARLEMGPHSTVRRRERRGPPAGGRPPAAGGDGDVDESAAVLWRGLLGL